MKNQSFENSEIIINDIFISSDTDSIVIPIGTVMQYFEYGSLGNYMGFYLDTDGSSYNSSQIQFNFNQIDEKKPRLNLMYRR